MTTSISSRIPRDQQQLGVNGKALLQRGLISNNKGSIDLNPLPDSQNPLRLTPSGRDLFFSLYNPDVRTLTKGDIDMAQLVKSRLLHEPVRTLTKGDIDMAQLVESGFKQRILPHVDDPIKLQLGGPVGLWKKEEINGIFFEMVKNGKLFMAAQTYRSPQPIPEFQESVKRYIEFHFKNQVRVHAEQVVPVPGLKQLNHLASQVLTQSHPHNAQTKPSYQSVAYNIPLPNVP
ncbi:hypothetical protein OAJ27_01690 [bacterium]|nr:hypothetical protein [bacterium]